LGSWLRLWTKIVFDFVRTGTQQGQGSVR
jgi:hypothetical protein